MPKIHLCVGRQLRKFASRFHLEMGQRLLFFGGSSTETHLFRAFPSQRATFLTHPVFWQPGAGRATVAR